MQIHELNSFIGTPGSGDYLAIDDGSETTKVEASNLGVTTQMTQAEAEAGIVTDPRVITPAVFKSSVDTLANAVAETVAETVASEIAESVASGIAESAAEKREVLVTTFTITALPVTVTNSKVSSDMVVVNSVLGTPSAQTSDWTVETYDESLRISGSISGTTALTLYLMKSR
jgi:hypothetical protein